jgi:hypothetical protein
MVWTDVAFRSLSELALKEEANCLNNSLVAEKLINGHVATQVRTADRNGQLTPSRASSLILVCT